MEPSVSIQTGQDGTDSSLLLGRHPPSSALAAAPSIFQKSRPHAAALAADSMQVEEVLTNHLPV